MKSSMAVLPVPGVPVIIIGSACTQTLQLSSTAKDHTRMHVKCVYPLEWTFDGHAPYIHNKNWYEDMFQDPDETVWGRGCRPSLDAIISQSLCMQTVRRSYFLGRVPRIVANEAAQQQSLSACQFEREPAKMLWLQHQARHGLRNVRKVGQPAACNFKQSAASSAIKQTLQSQGLPA